MAACDTQIQPKMTEANNQYRRAKGAISVSEKEPAQAKHIRSGAKSARSTVYRPTSPLQTQASLPEKDLLTRFRHVYAGKGGWYGYRGAKNSGPVHIGNIPSGFVSKYKREILRKLSKSLRAQAGQQQTPVDEDDKENDIDVTHLKKEETNTECNKRSIDTTNTPEIDGEQANTAPSSRCVDLGTTDYVLDGGGTRHGEQGQSSPGQTDDGRSENSKAIEAVCVENLPDEKQKQYRNDNERGSTPPKVSPHAPAVNGSDESSTNRPLNYEQADNTEKDISPIEISSSRVDINNSAGEVNAPQTVRSCPTRLSHKAKGGYSTQTQTGAGKGGEASTSSKKTGKGQRCRTTPLATNSANSKSKSKRALRSKSVKNVSGSDEAERIRMTLFSRLSQEAQWAISETRREMGVSSPAEEDRRPGSLVPSNASDPGDHVSDKDLDLDPPGDLPAELDGDVDPLDGRETVQPTDSQVHYKDYDAMPGPNPSERRFVGNARPKKSNTQDINKRPGDKSVRTGGLSRRRPDLTAETQISEIPASGINRRRPPSERSPQSSRPRNNRNRHSFHGIPNKTRLPEIPSELDEERSRIADMDGPYNHQRRIPGVGQYTIVGTHASLRREMTFEITPPGYDSRFNDLPRTDVEDDTPEEIKQMAIAKCTEWLMKHFVS